MNRLAWVWAFSGAVFLLSGNWAAAYCCLVIILYDNGVIRPPPTVGAEHGS